jgi:hypothetical protein
MAVNKLEGVPSSNLIPSAMGSRSNQAAFDVYDMSCDVEEYLMPNNLDEMTHGQRDCAAHLITADRLYLHSPPEALQLLG